MFIEIKYLIKYKVALLGDRLKHKFNNLSNLILLKLEFFYRFLNTVFPSFMVSNT